MVSTTKSRLSRFRFSLRTLLIVVTIASAAFGWLGVKVREAERQKEVVAVVQNLGGAVAYNYQIDSVGNWDPNAIAPVPAWLRNFFGEDFFAEVKLVYLCGRPATDESLVQIGKLSRLELLNVSYTQVTDDGMANLAGLTELRSLRLWNTKVTDTGFAQLRGLTRLRYLSLAETGVTDAALNQMSCYPELQKLSVWDTQVSDAALNELRRARPNLETND